MGNITRVSKYKRIKSSSGSLVDAGTGEVHDNKDGTFLQVENSDQHKMSYNNYCSLDLDKIPILLSKGLGQSELGLIIIMASNIEMQSQICMQENTNKPHTSKSISELCNESVQSINRKIKRLIKFNLVYKGRYYPYEHNVFVINNHLLKRGVYFKNELIDMFLDIKDDERVM